MKEQNTKLKNQLKELKGTLRDTLIKVQVKNQMNEKVPNSREETLTRDLEEQQRQIGVLKKEVQAVKNRLEGYHSQDR